MVQVKLGSTSRPDQHDVFWFGFLFWSIRGVLVAGVVAGGWLVVQGSRLWVGVVLRRCWLKVVFRWFQRSSIRVVVRGS